MPVQINDAVFVDIVADICDQLNAYLGTGAVIHFFDGTQPVDCSVADAGTELAAIPLSNPVFGTPTGVIFQTIATSPGSVSVSGTAQYWRMKDSLGATIMQGGCTDTSGEAMVFNSVTWTAAETLSFDFIVVTCARTGTP